MCAALSDLVEKTQQTLYTTHAHSVTYTRYARIPCGRYWCSNAFDEAARAHTVLCTQPHDLGPGISEPESIGVPDAPQAVGTDGIAHGSVRGRSTTVLWGLGAMRNISAITR